MKVVTAWTADADALVRSARAAFRPNDEDRERVFRALLPRVGGAAGGERAQSGAQAVVAAKPALAKLSMVLVGLGVAGAGSLWLGPADTLRSARPMLHVPAKPVQAPQASPAVVSESIALLRESPSERASAGAEARSGRDLGQEVAILSRAGSELRAGHPALALTELDEHQRKFPNGELAQERIVARIQALCMLDRRSEARAQLARLTAAAPGSPYEARVRKACGLEEAVSVTSE